MLAENSKLPVLFMFSADLRKKYQRIAAAMALLRSGETVDRTWLEFSDADFVGEGAKDFDVCCSMATTTPACFAPRIQAFGPAGLSGPILSPGGRVVSISKSAN